MEENAQSEFRVNNRDQSATAGVIAAKEVVLKHGPRVRRLAMVRQFADPTTGDVRKRELVLTSWDVQQGRLGNEHDKRRWRCEDDEIAALQAFLAEQLPESGNYRLAPSSAVAATDPNTGVVELMHRLAMALATAGDVPAGLSDMDEAMLVATILQRARHQTALDDVRRVVEDPDSTENDIQKVLGSQYWMFGGQYTNIGRRLLTIHDQIDIPLLRPDGSLHVVELKQANVSNLVVKYRNHLIPGPRVHEAVGQAMNYLVALDESRAQIKLDLGIETRQASATVVIGSPRFITADIDRDKVADTLRTYSAGLARVEVITFDDLLDAAQRSLRPELDDTFTSTTG